MKKCYVLVLFVLSSFTHFSQYVVGESALMENFGNLHPQITLNSLGQPLLIWSDGATKSVYCSLYDNGALTTATKINQTVAEVQTYDWSGPDVAIENENVYVVFKENGYETGHIYLAKSTDNGNNFTAFTNMDPLNVGYAQFPDVAVLHDTIYVAYMQLNTDSTDPQYVLSRSVDGGLSFQTTTNVGSIVGAEACDCCPPEIFVDENYVIIFFRNNASNIRDMKAVISYDRGNTFTQIAEIDTHNWFLNACPSSGPDAQINNVDNILYTIYKSSENSTGKVFLNAYDMNQNSSLNTLAVSEGMSNPNYPQLSVSGDTIGLVFEAVGISTDVYFNYSHQGINGVNVSNTMNLTNAQGMQEQPDLVYKNGKFHLVYADMISLKYLELVNIAGVEELQISKKQQDLIISKSSSFGEFDLTGKKCYSISGERIKNKQITELAIGTYFIHENNSIQKLIILP